jgi:hypothetical protein
VLFILIIYLIQEGFKQKFGRFDMPPAQLDKFICELLTDESIRASDLPILRDKILALGYTSLSVDCIIAVLKDTLHDIDDF